MSIHIKCQHRSYVLLPPDNVGPTTPLAAPPNGLVPRSQRGGQVTPLLVVCELLRPNLALVNYA